MRARKAARVAQLCPRAASMQHRLLLVTVLTLNYYACLKFIAGHFKILLLLLLFCYPLKSFDALKGKINKHAPSIILIHTYV